MLLPSGSSLRSACHPSLPPHQHLLVVLPHQVEHVFLFHSFHGLFHFYRFTTFFPSLFSFKGGVGISGGESVSEEILCHYGCLWWHLFILRSYFFTTIILFSEL